MTIRVYWVGGESRLKETLAQRPEFDLRTERIELGEWPADVCVLDGDQFELLSEMRRARVTWSESTLWLLSPDNIGDALVFLEGSDDIAARTSPPALVAHRIQRLVEGDAQRDSLTGVSNRHALLLHLSKQATQTTRSYPLSLLMIGIDKFKTVNDTHGHLAGDMVLQGLSRLFRQQFPGATIARTSGDGFVVVLRCNEQESLNRAKELVKCVRERKFAVEAAGDRGVRATISVGVITSLGTETPDELLSQVDRALYAAKAGGRNRAIHYSDLERSVEGEEGGLLIRDFQNMTHVISERVAEAINLRGRKMVEDLRRQAEEDALTGVHARRYLDRRLPFELSQTIEEGRTVFIALLDVDFFGKVNKTYGWPVGDYVLREIAQRIVATVRDDDWVSRYGGEEFCIVMKDVSASEASNVLERVRLAIMSEAFLPAGVVPDAESFQVTVSIGGTHCEKDGDSVSSVLNRVSAALLQAKGNGRNCVVIVDPSGAVQNSSATAL